MGFVYLVRLLVNLTFLWRISFPVWNAPHRRSLCGSSAFQKKTRSDEIFRNGLQIAAVTQELASWGEREGVRGETVHINYLNYIKCM